MATKALSIVDKVTIDRDGIIFVRLQNIRLLGDKVVGVLHHAFGIMPDMDPGYYFEGVSKNLVATGEGEPDDASSWDKVRRWTEKFHTADEVERYKERRRRRELREDPDAALDGAIVFDAIGALYDTPAAPRGRVDRVVAANPVVLMAGRRDGFPLSKISIEPGEHIGSEKTLRSYVTRIHPRVSDEALEEIARAGIQEIFRAIGGAVPDEDELGRLDRAVAGEHTPEAVANFRRKADAPHLD